jgi:hypothetical protein
VLGRYRSRHESRHGQPSVIADDHKYMTSLLGLALPPMFSDETIYIIFVMAIQSALAGFLWLYPIVECSVHHPKGIKKDLWALFIACVPLIGGLIYLIFGRPIPHETSKEKMKI